MNKRILYGTVSALALMLAAGSEASAQSTMTTKVDGNTAGGVNTPVTVDPANTVENFSFQNFAGALQVQQNGSLNSAVSQNLAIDAFKMSNINVGFFSQTTSTDEANTNSATNVTVTGANTVNNNALGSAQGAVQVQQNASVNSSTGQNTDIDPITDPGGAVGSVSATTTLTNTVNGNTATNDIVTGGNTITDGALQNAGGVFQVQQNASINSSTQQNLAVTNQDNTGGAAGPVPTVESDLTQSVGNNNSTRTSVDGSNTVSGNALQNAKGAFQVQQSNSANSAVGQNMAVGAFVAAGGSSTGGSGSAVAKSTLPFVGEAIGFPQPTVVDTSNAMGANAFQNAAGAFQVQQNGSINSAVGQNMAISAAMETGAPVDSSFSASASSTNSLNFQIGNPETEVNFTATVDNQINGLAFGAASGAFQVQQNRSINSSSGQNLKVAAITDPTGKVGSKVKASATLNSSVANGFVTNPPSGAFGNNTVDGAFSAASGQFQVQQNNSVNSSTQQNAAIIAVTAPGGSVASLATTTEGDLVHSVTGNLSLNNLGGANTANNAFGSASGHFQVQQSTSTDSAVGQNSVIVAIDAQNADAPVVGATGPDAALSTTTVSGNAAGIVGTNEAPVMHVDISNTIDGFSFQNAAGAFQVQQNGSINASVSQNMAITSVKENSVPTDLNLLATATSTDSITNNKAADVMMDTGANSILGDSFGAAAGAFQVQQNQSVNSSTDQNMRIIAITDPAAPIFSNFNSTGTLNATVGGPTGSENTLSDSTIAGQDTIGGNAFMGANGAFQVQQNNSINGSAQQNMAIEAITAPAAPVSAFSSDEVANLNSVVTGNTVTNVTVGGFNTIAANAFQNAKGAFQVQQSSAANSAVSQNMSIVSVSFK
jgi:hypothetical protein